MLRVRYKGTDLYPEGTVECLQADAYNVLDDNTVEILMYRDGHLDNIGVISADRWDSVMVIEEDAPCP